MAHAECMGVGSTELCLPRYMVSPAIRGMLDATANANGYQNTFSPLLCSAIKGYSPSFGFFILTTSPT